MLSKFQTTQCEINTQFEVCCCNDLTLTADKHLLNNESEMCVGPTADSPLTRLLVIFFVYHCLRLAPVPMFYFLTKGTAKWVAIRIKRAMVRFVPFVNAFYHLAWKLSYHCFQVLFYRINFQNVSSLKLVEISCGSSLLHLPKGCSYFLVSSGP